jgi:Flp pilus assembly protein TadD
MKTLITMLGLMVMVACAHGETSTNAPTVLSPAETAQNEFRIGSSWLQENNFAEATASFERATKAQPRFTEAYQQWAVALQQLGRLSGNPQVKLQRLQEAADKLSKAAELNPKERPVYLSWGETLVAIGDLPLETNVRMACYQGAIEKYQTATELDPKEWDAYAHWAAILSLKLSTFATNDQAHFQIQKEAADLYKKAAERASYTADTAALYAEWGAVLVRASLSVTETDKKQALLRAGIDKLKSSARAVSSQASTYTMWGSALVQLGKLTRLRSDFRDAVDQFNISLSLRPDDPMTLYALTVAQTLMANPILALETLKQCFAVDKSGACHQMAARDPDLVSLREERGFQELNTTDTPRGSPAFNPPLRNSPQ